MDAYQDQFKNWGERYRKILKRYRSEKQVASDDGGNSDPKFNVLYANISILQPAIYNRSPSPVVMRRYADRDPVGRVACDILQRSLSVQIEESDYDGTVRASRDDYLFGGRGTVWGRYEAAFGDEEDDGNGGSYTPVTSEKVEVDYVNAEDFAHAPARRWRDVTWVGRRLYLTEEGAEQRFGKEAAAKLSFRVRKTGPDQGNNAPGDENLGTEKGGVKRCAVWEIWDRETHKVYFYTPEPEKKGDGLIETTDIPYKLKGFFPCPEPLYGIMTPNTLVPVPDFMQYQDQALEMDVMTSRMGMLIAACKVSCLYDAALKNDITNLFTGSELQATPVDDFASKYATGNQPGVSSHLAFTPIQIFAETYNTVRAARAQVKADIDELTGISDIVRGQSDPNETLGAQKMKGGYASMRLSERQNAVARFCRDILRTMGEIMCQQFDDETLLDMSGALFMDPASQTHVMEALQMLRNANARTFRIEIETNSTVALEEQEDKSQRLEFLTTIGAFMEKAAAIAKEQPLLAPFLKESLMFAVRGFKIGRQLEGEMDEALEKVVQASQQQAQQGPPPSPEMMKTQADIQSSQAKTQADIQNQSAKTQADIQLDQVRAANDVRLDKARAAAGMVEQSLAYQLANSGF